MLRTCDEQFPPVQTFRRSVDDVSFSLKRLQFRQAGNTRVLFAAIPPAKKMSTSLVDERMTSGRERSRD